MWVVNSGEFDFCLVLVGKRCCLKGKLKVKSPVLILHWLAKGPCWFLLLYLKISSWILQRQPKKNGEDMGWKRNEEFNKVILPVFISACKGNWNVKFIGGTLLLLDCGYRYLLGSLEYSEKRLKLPRGREKKGEGGIKILFCLAAHARSSSMSECSDWKVRKS